MKIIDHTYDGPIPKSFPFPKEELLFFDIETTGFSPKTSAIYLIGVLYYDDHSWNCKQWFADDYQSEESLLTAFFHFLSSYSYLIHFNGTGFDIPFLEKKCQAHQLTGTPYSFEQIQSLDLYQAIYPYRKKLNTENLKQKTLEQFWGIQREDLYTGGQLIKFYQAYMKEKQMGKEINIEQVTQLILHNYEDLCGMLQFFGILDLSRLLGGTLSLTQLSATIQGSSLLQVTATTPTAFPVTLCWTDAGTMLCVEQNTLTLRVPILQTELKLFYDNYKDYYYLPLEDTAMHKSIATYVDRDYRKKATKQTCYTRQNGAFIITYSASLTPQFRESYDSPVKYLSVSDAFLQDPTALEQYVRDFIQYCPDLLLTVSKDSITADWTAE